MKFITFVHKGKEQIGVLSLDESKVLKISKILGHERYEDMNQFIEEATELDLDIIAQVRINEKDLGTPVEEIRYLAPIVKPKHDIICVGVNYASHLKESTLALKEDLSSQKSPVYFSKRTTRILGHEEAVRGFFDIDEELDYEVEVAVIIGKRGINIPKDQVEDYIFGYSIFNDVSSRTLQKGHLQWYKGKSLDTHSVLGPVILHRSALPLPLKLKVESRVNGEVRQSSSTELFLHDIATIISDFSRGITLEPGDIIATGTPSGVGMGFDPPRFMKKGDVVECEVEKIGILKSTIVE